METKICSKCGKELAIDNFGKDKGGKNGLVAECKECRKQHYRDNKAAILEYSKQHYRDNEEAIAKYHKEYYQDNKETIAKQMKQYHQDNKVTIAEYHKGYSQQYYQDNKETIVKYREKWRQDNKAAIVAQNKQYRQDNKVTIAKKGKQYQQEHVEYYKQYAKDNKEILKEKAKQYLQEHLEENCVRNQIRRAKKRLLPSTLTIQQWEDIKEVFNNSCCYCGKELPLEQEHFIALTKFGEYSHNNIICACKSCNSSKHDKNFFDWYPKQSYYSKQREKRILKYLGYEKGIQQLSIL